MFALGVTPCDGMGDLAVFLPISYKRTQKVLTFYFMGHANAMQRIVNILFRKRTNDVNFLFFVCFSPISNENVLSALNSIAVLVVTCSVAETR